MPIIEKILIGFFVGFLCGLIPLAYGLVSKQKVLSISGIAASAITGVLLSLIDKSPFTAMIMAIIFVIIIFTKNKHGSEESEEEE